MKTLLRLLSAALVFPAVLQAGQVIFTEVMYHPVAPLPEYVEITNLTSNRVDLAGWTVEGGIRYTFPDFNPAASSAHFLKEYERVILSSMDEAATRAALPHLPPSVRVFGPFSGSLNNAGDDLILTDAASARQCALSYGDDGDWPVAADGTGHSLQIINQNGNVDDWRNWRASRYAGGSPGTAEPAATETGLANPDKLDRTVVDYRSQWKYWRETADPDGAEPEGTWYGPAFAETGWQGPSPGFFGHDPSNGSLTEALGTPFTAGYTNATRTYYYRTTFQWNGSLTGQSFNLDQWVDDGVIYYLNGQELRGTNLGRIRMATGVASHTSFASGIPVGGDAVEEINVLSGSLDGWLVAGTNVLCAEVHQHAASAEDTYFGARFRISTPAVGGLVINEVKPSPQAGNGFVEFFNPTGTAIDLNGYYLSDSDANLTKFRIAVPMVVPAGGRAVVGFSESSLGNASPVTVILTRPDGITREAAFGSPMLADGRSAGRLPDGAATWVLFAEPTPGAVNAAAPPRPTIALSEISFAGHGRADWVEVYNTGTGLQDLSGLFVASRPDLYDKVALTGNIAASGYASVNVDFTPSSNGSLVLYLSDARNNILDTAEVTRRAGLASVQAWPAGAREWYATPATTRDTPNQPERSTAVVINEIMAKPPSGHDEGEYVELYNRSAAAVDLAGWQFSDGISYTFPAGAVLPAGAYLVLAKNPAWMTSRYTGMTHLYGPYEGTLRNRGEELYLEDARGNPADVVDYKQGGQWPVGAGGEGSSLELLHPSMDNSQASSWRASDETAKSTFESYSHTGTYRELRGIGPGASTSRELLLNLVGDGYVILRNIKLSKASAPGTNLIPNGDATSHNGNGASGFLCTGTHCDSDSMPRSASPVRYNALLTAEPGFHLISQGGGDTKANKAEVDVTGIAANDVLTLSFEARWVYGLPLMVAQTWDRSFGKVFRFPVPDNLGTPGAVNSRFIPAPAPTVDAMSHFPVVPTASQPVLVTARVTSADALVTVVVKHRQDTVAGNGAWAPVAMNDDGTGGDARAGDGIWTASIPARANGAITQFYIEAAAGNGQTNECPREGARRPGMWIVSNTPPSTAAGLLIQRNIISQQHRNALNVSSGFSAAFDFDHPKMSNYSFNATLIFNESEVYYNCELRRGGSPWSRTTSSTLDRSRWKPPGDQRFRERAKSGIDNDSSTAVDGGVKRFHNRMVRYMLYLFGYPVPHSEFVVQIVNTDAARLGDDMEQTDSDFFDRAYPVDAEGELFEIDDAWYMYDSNSMDDRLDAGNVSGRWALTDWNNPAIQALPSEESPIFFHGNWPLRFPEERYDYSSLASMIKTSVNNNSSSFPNAAAETAYREKMERVLDADRTAIYAAVRAYAADWDNFTMGRGKNGYFYKRPTDGRFEFHHWDSDLAFQSDRTNDAILGSAGGLGWTNLTNRPWFRQKFNHALSVLIDRYTAATSGRMNAWLDALNYQIANTDGLAAFKNTNFNYRTGWFTARNAEMQTQLGSNFTRAFTITSPGGTTVTNPVFTLTGAASSKVASVEIAGHPGAVFAWVPVAANLGQWTLTNIRLAGGINNLSVRALLSDGSVSATLPFTVTLTGNAPPAAILTAEPSSGNVAAGEIVQLDATASFDPEGQPLQFAWSVTPSANVILTQPAPGRATVRFGLPGHYSLTLQVTDAAALTATVVREFSVYNAGGFSSFGLPGVLGPEYALTNLEHRDNFSPSAWYSLNDVTGRILVQVLEDAARPLIAPSFTHPQITRDLPDSADFILQTSLRSDSREFGNWSAGLTAEMNEAGTLVRYAFALEGGLNVTVRRAVLPANYDPPVTTAITGSGAILRILRSGNSLLFQRRNGDFWETVRNQALPAGTVAVQGGLFVATSLATSIRAGFDYLLVADPTVTNHVLNSLRITEINYRPTAGGVEFIELRNTGMAAINLSGVSFVEGQPFSMLGNPVTPYTFSTEILAPGEFIVLTDNPAGFRNRYGMEPRLAPAWTSGSLSNSGEEIVLVDASGNVIHDFAYSPLAPWPVEANGGGSSLEIVSIEGDYNAGTNWRASARAGGHPGQAPDRDGDGVPDEAEALFGTNPDSAGSVPGVTLTPGSGGGLTLSWPSIPGVIYRVESSPAMAGWTTQQTVTGLGTWSFTPTPGEGRRFYRVSASTTP